MFAYWLWTCEKAGSHFANFKQVKNLVVILLALKKSKKLVAILLLIVGHDVAILKCMFWESNFEVYLCSELFFEFLFIHYGCSCVFEKFSARVRKNKNTQSTFNIPNIVFTLLI